MSSTPPEPEPGPASSLVSFTPLAFTGASTTLLLFGATSSVFGPLVLSFAHRYHLSLPTAGSVLSVFFVGAFIGVPLGWWGVGHLHGSTVLTGVMGLMVVGSCGAAWSRTWPEFVSSVFVIGVAFGGSDFSLNTLLVRTEMRRRAHRLSLANAGFGVGAVLGPVLIVVVRPHNFAALFVGFAVAAMVLTTLYRGIEAPAIPLTSGQRLRLRARPRRRAILVNFVVAYVLYVAAETSTSGWIAPQLHQVGYSQSVASVVTAGFWGGLAIGRMIGGPLARRWSDRALVLGGLTLAVGVALAAGVDEFAPFAYPLLGLIIASVYPMGLIWYTTLSPDDSDGLAILIVCMMLGGIIGPAAEGLVVSMTGIHAVPVVIATFVLSDLLVFASARRYETPPTSPRPA